MNRFFVSPALGAVCLVLMAVSPEGAASAQHAANQTQTLGDLSTFRSIAADTLAIVNTGNLTRAKARITDLETTWDAAEPRLRPRDAERWRIIDKAIDAALAQLRADKAQAQGAKGALQDLLASLDRPAQPATAGAGAPAQSTKLFVTDIITAAEKLQADATVLDVSFEPKDGQPVFAVRTYANGKVWDGLFEGSTGATIGEGTLTDESALDAEDKAEVAALKGARITLRQAIASAEQNKGGRALNAGLEQVRGRAVWEILIQITTQPQQVHIDPVTGKIL